MNVMTQPTLDKKTTKSLKLIVQINTNVICN